ncbi:MAG TPA: hypothetical protein VHH88_09415, partial [Verrucomicrobiae bacterium]|nr:hypothetical protein [Verrucomicrobiae bacterium]
MDLPIGFLARLRQRLKKILPVNVINKNVLAPVTPVHHMINGHRDIELELGVACLHLNSRCGLRSSGKRKLFRF